jgi:hypothetical protein
MEEKKSGGKSLSGSKLEPINEVDWTKYQNIVHLKGGNEEQNSGISPEAEEKLIEYLKEADCIVWDGDLIEGPGFTRFLTKDFFKATLRPVLRPKYKTRFISSIEGKDSTLVERMVVTVSPEMKNIPTINSKSLHNNHAKFGVYVTLTAKPQKVVFVGGGTVAAEELAFWSEPQAPPGIPGYQDVSPFPTSPSTVKLTVLERIKPLHAQPVLFAHMKTNEGGGMPNETASEAGTDSDQSMDGGSGSESEFPTRTPVLSEVEQDALSEIEFHTVRIVNGRSVWVEYDKLLFYIAEDKTVWVPNLTLSRAFRLEGSNLTRRLETPRRHGENVHLGLPNKDCWKSSAKSIPKWCTLPFYATGAEARIYPQHIIVQCANNNTLLVKKNTYRNPNMRWFAFVFQGVIEQVKKIVSGNFHPTLSNTRLCNMSPCEQTNQWEVRIVADNVYGKLPNYPWTGMQSRDMYPNQTSTVLEPQAVPLPRPTFPTTEDEALKPWFQEVQRVWESARDLTPEYCVWYTMLPALMTTPAFLVCLRKVPPSKLNILVLLELVKLYAVDPEKFSRTAHVS